jgi:transposase
MAHFVGLDVLVKETSVCVVEDAGAVVCERKVPTEPDDIAVLLTSIGGDYVRVGIEAGPLSQWLVNGLSEAGLPVICVETRHVKALLQAQQINKSDRNAARGIAQMMRVGLFKPVHVKTLSKYAASDTTAPNRSPAGRSGTPSRMVRLPCREIRGKACDRAGARRASGA